MAYYTPIVLAFIRVLLSSKDVFFFSVVFFSFFFTISTLLCNFTCLFARFYSRSLIVCTSESYHLISEPSLISVILKVHFFFFSFFLSFFAFKGFACLFHFKLQLASLCTKSLLSLSRSLAVLLSLSRSLSLATSLSPSLSEIIDHSLSRPLSLSVLPYSISFCLLLCLFLSVTVFLSVFVCVCLSSSQCLSV